MSSDLFRQEVLDAKRVDWLGLICSMQPIRFWVLAICAAVIALAITLLLVFGTYTRRSRVARQLVPVSKRADKSLDSNLRIICVAGAGKAASNGFAMGTAFGAAHASSSTGGAVPLPAR